MSVGIIMLVHTALDRAEQVARHWSAAGCPLVIHVDASLAPGTFAAFQAALADLPDLRFCARHRCAWGTWGLVAASQSAAELMLQEFPAARHIYLASGACLPLRPVRELIEYLADRPQTDFIESATTSDAGWTVGGLDVERFTLRFPFSWRNHRRLFDRYVALQRRLGMSRRIPAGLVPHMGSQWWCLTRQTLSAILSDPRRAEYDRYFSKVWIPDGSYFQTLARKHSDRIESRSLTLSKFDHQGRPHVFYDDHLKLLRRSHCFVARKIWPQAGRLYGTFPLSGARATAQAQPDPARIDRMVAKAAERRKRGRAGLYMQSRFPTEGRIRGLTADKYSVFQGFSEVFEDFEQWLASATDATVHGHLFAPGRAEFAHGVTSFDGALSDSAALRDYNPQAFLTNLVWNTRGERQCFQFGPRDNQDINWAIAKDPNAQISVISGAWAVPLFQSGDHFVDVRRRAARLQQIESEHLEILTSSQAKANVRIWTMAEFVAAPIKPLRLIIDEINRQQSGDLTQPPRMVDLTGFGRFLQDLKNQGMHPYLMGNFPVAGAPAKAPAPSRKPYPAR